jgi:type I restriction enzyme S subunit
MSENLDSKRIPITQNKRKKGIYPYYGATGIVDYVDDYIFDEDLLLVSEDGANLIMRNYPIAFSVTGKIWVNNHAHVLRFNNINTQRFIEYYFSVIKLDKFITGAAQPKLNQAALNSIKVKIPSLNEQLIIVEKLDQVSELINPLISNYQEKHSKLLILKQSILHKAFQGEL